MTSQRFLFRKWRRQMQKLLTFQYLDADPPLITCVVVCNICGEEMDRERYDTTVTSPDKAADQSAAKTFQHMVINHPGRMP